MNKAKFTLVSASLLSFILATSGSAAMDAASYDAEGGMFTVNGSDNSGGNPPGTMWGGTGRLDMGWGGNGGGNLEAYSKGHVDRSGQFKFIYGGASTMGKIVFTHYNGATWTDRMILTNDGRLGIDIGASDPCADCKLDVNGKIRAEEILVETGAWPDYVFKDGYDLQTLSEVEEFIKLNGHLPGMPKAENIETKGVGLGELSKLMLEKVEELTLHMIELEKKNKDLENQLTQLKKIDD